MQFFAGIQTSKPEGVLENGLLTTTNWNFPCGAIVISIITFIAIIDRFLWDKVSAITEDGRKHIINLKMRDGWLLSHRCKANHA